MVTALSDLPANGLDQFIRPLAFARELSRGASTDHQTRSLTQIGNCTVPIHSKFSTDNFTLVPKGDSCMFLTWTPTYAVTLLALSQPPVVRRGLSVDPGGPLHHVTRIFLVERDSLN